MTPARYWFEITWRTAVLFVWNGVGLSLGYWFLISHIELLGFSVFHIGGMAFLVMYPLMGWWEKRPRRPGTEDEEHFVQLSNGSSE